MKNVWNRLSLIQLGMILFTFMLIISFFSITKAYELIRIYTFIIYLLLLFILALYGVLARINKILNFNGNIYYPITTCLILIFIGIMYVNSGVPYAGSQLECILRKPISYTGVLHIRVWGSELILGEYYNITNGHSLFTKIFDTLGFKKIDENGSKVYKVPGSGTFTFKYGTPPCNTIACGFGETCFKTFTIETIDGLTYQDFIKKYEQKEKQPTMNNPQKDTNTQSREVKKNDLQDTLRRKSIQE